MRFLLFVLVLVVLALGLVLPAVYFFHASRLPPLESASAIRGSLARRIESQRMAHATFAARGKAEKFAIEPLERLPRPLVAVVLSLEECPGFLTAPHEGGLASAVRLVGSAFGLLGEAGPGRCQLRFAWLIASATGVEDSIRLAIASHRVLEALTPADLVAYRLAAWPYAEDVVGVGAGSIALFGKEVKGLGVAESAELALAELDFEAVLSCKNAAALKLERDSALDRTLRDGLLSAVDVAVAKAEPVACSKGP